MMRKLLSVIVALSLLGCVQQTQPKKITFKLKLVDTVDITSVEVRGNLAPLSWETGIPLTDADKDGMYVTDIEMHTANFDLEFKFVVNDSVFELENQNNRQIQFKYQPETIIYDAVYNSPEPTQVTRN